MNRRHVLYTFLTAVAPTKAVETAQEELRQEALRLAPDAKTTIGHRPPRHWDSRSQCVWVEWEGGTERVEPPIPNHIWYGWEDLK